MENCWKLTSNLALPRSLTDAVYKCSERRMKNYCAEIARQYYWHPNISYRPYKLVSFDGNLEIWQ